MVTTPQCKNNDNKAGSVFFEHYSNVQILAFRCTDDLQIFLISPQPVLISKFIIMKAFIIITAIIGGCCFCSSAQVIRQNTELIRQIDSMFKTDQFWRHEFIKVQPKGKLAYSDETIQSKWIETDSINHLKARAVIKKYGYPGYNLVGESSDNFWAIVQHCDNDIVFRIRCWL